MSAERLAKIALQCLKMAVSLLEKELKDLRLTEDVRRKA